MYRPQGNGSQTLTASDRAPCQEDPSVALYLDLLKKVLVNMIYLEHEYQWVVPTGLRSRLVCRLCRAMGWSLHVSGRGTEQSRCVGRDRPAYAHTMIGIERLDSLERCVRDVVRDQVPGDLLEAGTWRGGASIFMRGVLKALDVTDRTVWVADSFQGLPPPDPKYAADRGDTHHLRKELSIPLEEVQRNFARYRLLDEQVRFLAGWFKDTLCTDALGALAVIRLDGDMYESTFTALSALYPRLSPGGYALIDDYGAIPACKEAVHDYRAKHNITDPIVTNGWTEVYWRKAG